MKRIKVTFELFVNEEAHDYDDFMLYLPEKLTECFCCDESEVVETDELYDEDVKVKILKDRIPKSRGLTLPEYDYDENLVDVQMETMQFKGGF